MLDFSQKMYRKLCQSINESNYRAVIMGDYFATENSDKPRMFLRHDVDRDPTLSLETASIENEYNQVSTYFFRVIDSIFKPEIIKQIAAMGHEIGYHYECLDKTKGDYKKAYQTAIDDLHKLREITPVKSMAMHGNPLTKWDNRDLWKKYDFRELDIEVAAYLNLDYKKIRYFSDTGRTWEENRGNIYDFVSDQPKHALKTTLDLINYLSDHKQDTCILIHPNRWSDQISKWLYNWAFDTAANTAKSIIKSIRK